MNPTLRNVLALFAGLVLGNVVNMALIMIGVLVVPLPEGVNVMDPESLKEALPTLPPASFIFPWLAHAGGTLAGACLTAALAVGPRRLLAMVIGGLFLLFGIANLMMLAHPVWFAAVDLIGAYLPMGWLGGYLVTGGGSPAEEPAS